MRKSERGVGRLDDLSGVHHRDAVGATGHHAEVVGDEQDRHAAIAPQLLEQLEDLGLHRDVERGGRLVGDQQLGVRGERDRDHDALAEAAAQLVRIRGIAEPRIGNSHLAEQRDRAVLRLARRRLAVGADRLRRPGRPTVKTGLRLVMGSWKTMPIRPPRTARISDSGSASRSVPSSEMRAPSSIRPGGGTRRSRARLVRLLPQPDSPTSARVSPRAMREADAVDGVHRAAAQGEGQAEILDLEEGCDVSRLATRDS